MIQKVKKIKSIFKFKNTKNENENIIKMQALYSQNNELLKKLLEEAQI